MIMGDSELKRSIAEAKAPYKQVEILAQLNGVSYTDMKNKLTALGIMPKRPYEHRGAIPKKDRIKKVEEVKKVEEIKEIETIEEVNNAETCVSCGEIIPEGRQICPICEDKLKEDAIKPSYYNDSKISPWDVIDDWNLGFNLGSIMKYIKRAGKKDGNSRLQDLKKIRAYVEREIEKERENGND